MRCRSIRMKRPGRRGRDDRNQGAAAPGVGYGRHIGQLAPVARRSGAEGRKAGRAGDRQGGSGSALPQRRRLAGSPCGRRRHGDRGRGVGAVGSLGRCPGLLRSRRGEPGQVSGGFRETGRQVRGGSSGASRRARGSFPGASAEPVGVPGTSDPAASEAEALAAPKVAAISEPAPAAAGSETLERAGPAVRRLMREHRVDSSAIRGTGRGGRITKSECARLHRAQIPTRQAGRRSDARAQAQRSPGRTRRPERT